MRSEKEAEPENVIELIKRCDQLACRQLCESILAVEQTAADNPFVGAFWRLDAIDKNRARDVYGDVAEHVINVLDFEFQEKNITRDEYVSLREYSRDVGGYIGCPSLQRINKSSIESIAESIIDELAWAFSVSLMNICESVYLGAPLYTKDSETGNFQLVDSLSEDRSFMYGLGKNAIEFRCTTFPAWMSDYYFKRTEIEAQHSFFSGSDLSEQQLESLRLAYSQSIAEQRRRVFEKNNSVSSIERIYSGFVDKSNTIEKEKSTIRYPTTKEIAEAFKKPSRIKQDWEKFLSDNKRISWLFDARVEGTGSNGIACLWRPHIFAVCMLAKKDITLHQADVVINAYFKDWLEAWEKVRPRSEIFP